MSIKVMINGAMGRMGQKVTEMVENDPALEVAAKVDGGVKDIEGVIASPTEYDGTPDVVIDFSFHAAVPALMEYCANEGVPAVVATTGLTEDEAASIESASEKTAIFRSANMSVGIALLKKLVKEAAKVFPESEVEIIEAHHDQKLDAPSGTAIMLADAVKEERPDATYKMGRSGQAKRTPEEIGIHSLRMGNVTGEHEVIFAMPNQTIKLKHEAHDRALFADGAIAAAKFLVGKAPGMYGMEDMLGE